MSSPHLAEAAIQQINLGYNAEQDRLLFRVGLSDNTELLVWLTNRITNMMWSLLTGEAHLPTATSIQAATPPEQAVEQFKQEMQAVDALQKMDFKTEYINDMTATDAYRIKYTTYGLGRPAYSDKAISRSNW